MFLFPFISIQTGRRLPWHCTRQGVKDFQNASFSVGRVLLASLNFRLSELEPSDNFTIVLGNDLVMHFRWQEVLIERGGVELYLEVEISTSR